LVHQLALSVIAVFVINGDKAIGHDGFTILSNHQTGKIAMMVESTNSKEVQSAMELFGDKLSEINPH